MAIDYSGLSPTLELLAGSIGGSGNLDGTGAIARFSFPHGVAVDSAGNVFVADSTTIRKITREGTVTTLAGVAGEYGFADGAGSAARFNVVSGIAVDRAGALYVADTGNNAIRKISPQGLVTTLAGSPAPASAEGCRFADGIGAAAAFCVPSGVAVDSGGTVYVADTQNALIRKITPAGVVTTLAGSLIRPRPCDPFNPCTPGPSTQCTPCPPSPSVDGSGGSARFGYPYGIAVDGEGTVYVAEGFGNSTIRKITPAGVVTTLAGRAAGFFDPRGIAVDGGGTLYVADKRANVIRKVTPAGEVTTLAGGATWQEGSDDGTGSEARFLGPWGVAVDAGGVVYVADSGNSTIRKITPVGAVTTFAGDAPKSGFVDGNGAAARFESPLGVAVDSSGVAYVADCYNSTIRTITPSGAVTTLAGSPDHYGFADGTGSAARFSCPIGIAVDGLGAVYVTDIDNHTIRKIAPGGTVTTLAGTAGTTGSADGTGPAAQFGFSSPTGIAVDDVGTAYVADNGKSTIRRISREGVVTTLAGSAGSNGAVDGAGDAARLGPGGIDVDPGRRISFQMAAPRSEESIRRTS